MGFYGQHLRLMLERAKEYIREPRQSAARKTTQRRLRATGGVVDHLTRLNYAIIVRADANAVYTGMYMEKTTVRE